MGPLDIGPIKKQKRCFNDITFPLAIAGKNAENLSIYRSPWPLWVLKVSLFNKSSFCLIHSLGICTKGAFMEDRKFLISFANMLP